MSAILRDNQVGSPTGDLGTDGVRRYKTRCKILVDSHNAGATQGDKTTVEITDDVFSVDMSKTIKGAGNATVSLTPSQNYLNLVFPNDYVNIYFDIGDGSGWTRTFFGFVDRVEESYSVASSGAPSTTYRLVCTDFYKAFDKTMIYFNPQLNGRKDFAEYDFAAPNIGGLALMSRGIIVGGSPSDIVENVTNVLLGFGTQFRLPPSYHPGKTQDRLRQRRVESVRGRLSSEAKENLSAAGNSYRRLRTKIQDEATFSVSFAGATSINEEDRLQLLAEAYGLDDTAAIEGKTDEQLAKYLADFKVGETLNPTGIGGDTATARSLGARDRNILDSTIQDHSSLIDVIDTFTFIERRAIDGYILGQPVWQSQGSIASILTSFSNEAVNELFYDLRPLSDDGSGKQASDDPIAGKYITIPDDKNGNVDSTGGAVNGVTHIPAVIMREYPFSTVDSVDLSGTELSLKDAEGEQVTIGDVTFGDIFNQGPNDPGRHVTYIPNINVPDTVGGEAKQTGLKHIDVAVISEREVINSSLGRSDNDHFNLFEFYSDNLLGTDQKFYMRDFLPIVTPIHVARNGLRVRSVTTRAARFSLGQIINVRQPTPKPAEKVKEGDTLPAVAKGDIIAPVDSPGLVTYSPSQALSNWNYREKTVAGGNKWKWHNGIDITRKGGGRVGGKDIPIYAIADGWVVVSAPEGAYQGYGNIVVIKHDFDGVAGPRYSVYAHLSARAVGWGLGFDTTNRRRRGMFAAKDMTGIGLGGGQKVAKKISKGDLVGWMGHSGTSDSADHLHFEIDKKFPPYAGMKREYTPDILLSVQPSRPGLKKSANSAAISGQNMPAGFNSCDPNAFFTFQDKDLASLINDTDDNGGETQNDDTGNAEDEQDDNASKADEGIEDPADEAKEGSSKSVTRDSVDTATSRKQISRWALLQDHWYQHNLEYLSGRFDMRGAPEIRVGYRLDVLERNMSFYVEGVNHSWQFPNNMKTSLSVTRGQPNNPYPIYVLPAFDRMGATDSQRRTSKSRLATYFITPDPVAIRRSLFLRPAGSSFDPGALTRLIGTGSEGANQVDVIDEWDEKDQNIAVKYNEAVIPAGATNKVDEELPEADATGSSSGTRNTGTDPSAGVSKDNPQGLKR